MNNKRIFTFLISLLAITTLVSSCVPSGKTNRAKKTTTDTDSSTEVDNPTYETSNNYFEYSGTKYATNFSTPYTFDDNLYFKGSAINSYVQTNPTTVVCSVFHYTGLPGVVGSRNLVVAGLPRSIINFSTNTKEYYYSLNFKTINKEQNVSFCSGLDFTSKVTSTLGGDFVYDLDELCPTCSNISYQNSQYLVATTLGVVPKTLNQTVLGLKVNFGTSTSTGGLCTTNSECSNLGLNCCINGQCVQDGALKRTYSASDSEYSDYLAALLSVSSDPVTKKNYPQFYYICGTNPTNPDTSDDEEEDDFTPEELSQILIQKLKYLYECTTPIEGEMGICTATYENAQPSATPFITGEDDRDFSEIYTGSNGALHSIKEVLYQGEVIYSSTVDGTGNVTISGRNDNLTDTTKVLLSKAYDSDNKYKDLQIRYMVDASCELINSSLAKCYKEYIQSQDLGKVTDHWPATNSFKIPAYAATDRDIIVSVDDAKKTKIDISQKALYTADLDKWYLDTNTTTSVNTNQVVFTYSSLAAQPQQKVKITYYVDTSSTFNNVLNYKQTALEEIGELCACPKNNCSLIEVLDDNSNVINYECKYPPVDLPEPPLQQQVVVSTKNTPHRHFTTNGVAKTDLTTAEILDKPELGQEGTAFKYENSNLLTPNNLTTDVGFNEIYGSFTYSTTSAQPAKQVLVKKGVTYDISSEDGTFSTCFYCGTDYYSSLTKLFPDNFYYGAGGYKPYLASASKLSPSSDSIRADDLSFGRACFVPATMLPWSHTDDTTTYLQRRRRLSTQHFLFANGYNRDWYGFDYGSLIGSFDGVRWFSVGSKRRIKATSNKLFLAINSYYSDLNGESSYNVLIQDSTINGPNSFPTTDFESDGAQCQQVHSCNKDSDCAAALGWDYACENVSTISSRYPKFDDNATELYYPNASIEKLLSLTGTYTGSTKRCVYKGKGSLCSPSLSGLNASTNYSNTASVRLNSCSANNYCQPLTGSSTPSVFNTKINRYGKSVKIRNLQSNATEVTSFGLQAPLIGRGENYQGTDSIDPYVVNILSNNNVTGICLPGKAMYGDTTDANQNPFFNDLFSTSPTSIGDPVNNLGKTMDITAVSGIDSAFYNSCPVFNTDGNYAILESGPATTRLNDSAISVLAATQNLSTKQLDIFYDEGLIDDKITKNFDSEIISSVSLNQNSCLRAPGSTCFTDFDCGPSKNIADKLKSISSSDLGSSLNIYELLFWQENLVCSQPSKTTESSYDIRNNRCCRETDKTITIPTTDIAMRIESKSKRSVSSVAVNNALIPGTEISMSSPSRYSRTSSSKYFVSQNGTVKNMQVAVDDTCSTGTCSDMDDFLKQYEALSTIAKRTCCSENWVRNFQNSSNIPSGHDWKPEKFQKPSVTNFKCLNYTDISKTNCTDPFDPTQCTSREITTTEASTLNKWFSSFELTGIPNVAINDPSAAVTSDYLCESDPTSFVPGFITDTYNETESEYIDSNNLRYIKANDSTAMTASTKQIFSDDTFSCCLPAGSDVADTESDTVCCTGYVNPTTKKCALRNYNDVSIYLNRYVSSEAQELPSTSFDTRTGEIKDAAVAVQVACEKRICASGYLAYGIAYGSYKYNNIADDAQLTNVNRFIENLSSDDEVGLATLFSEGLKWNNHVYCVPEDVANNLLSAGYTVFNCN